MIWKVTALCVAMAMICSALRPQRPEMATALSLASGLAAVLLILSQLTGPEGWIRGFRALLGANEDLAGTVIKGAGVAVLSEMGAQLCADAGESALAGRITLAARIAMLGLCAPMIARLAEAIGGALS